MWIDIPEQNYYFYVNDSVTIPSLGGNITPNQTITADGLYEFVHTELFNATTGTNYTFSPRINGVVLDVCKHWYFGGYEEGSLYLEEDLRMPATAINPPGQPSDPDFDEVNGGYLFDAASEEIILIIAQMPHSWIEGSNIKPHVHWQPTNTNTGNVNWSIRYKWVDIGETEPGSWETVSVLDPAEGTAYKHQITNVGIVDGTGHTLSSILTIFLSRKGADAADTYNTDALLKEFDIHYSKKQPDNWRMQKTTTCAYNLNSGDVVDYYVEVTS